MPEFKRIASTNKKSGQHDYWAVDNQIDWAYIRAPLAQRLKIPENTPIRLHVGNERTFGANHIYKKHRRKEIQDLLRKKYASADYIHICNVQAYAPAFLWLKLNSSGTAYTTEDDNKTKIYLSLTPSSLLVLTLHDSDREIYYSVTTLYMMSSNRGVDGQRIGRYRGDWVNNKTS